MEALGDGSHGCITSKNFETFKSSWIWDSKNLC